MRTSSYLPTRYPASAWVCSMVMLLAGARVLAYQEWFMAGYCKFRECCHPNDGTGYILYDKGCDNLLVDLKMKVYGQPLITKHIYKSIKAHMATENPSRPLVMYFSGGTGTGKTYVAQMIARNLFKMGMKSRFVRYISSTYHFSAKIESEQEISAQQKRLRDMIHETVSNCERSLIILDELDKLPAGIVDILQPMLDYVDDIAGLRYNKAIFIFLTNTGADQLYSLTFKNYKEGNQRHDMPYKDIEEILLRASYNEKGGLKESNLLERYSISVVVPFLPLERSHIKQCIRAQIENSPVIPDNIEQLIEEIADEVLYFPKGVEMYSKSGCKGIYDKVVGHIGPPIQHNLHSGDKLKGSKHVEF